MIQGIQVSLMDVMDRKVEPHGRKDIPLVDSSLELPSYLSIVQIGQLLFQFGVEEVEVVLRGIPMVDSRAKELAWFLLHGSDGDLVALVVLEVEPNVLDQPSLDGEGSALTGFVGESHC